MNKLFKVFLDDMRIPSDIYGCDADEEWIVVATVEEVFDLLKSKKVSYLSLDNDLGLNNKEGHVVIPWMMENNYWPTDELFVHSANPYWRNCMQLDINRYFYGCIKPQTIRNKNA